MEFVTCSLKDYFEREFKAVDKHEYVDGQIIAMPLYTIWACRIATDLICLLHEALGHGRDQVYSSNLRIGVPSLNHVTYASGQIIRGEGVLHPDDRHECTVINPLVIIDVLPRNESEKRKGDRTQRFLQIDTLREYVRVEQTKAQIETHFRDDAGVWTISRVSGRDSVLKLRSIGMNLRLTDVYHDLTLADPSFT